MSVALAGVGIGLRKEFHGALLETPRHVDWLEIIAENFMDMGGRPARALARCRERWPIVAHGVALSVGGPDDMAAYLDSAKRLVTTLDAPFFSDHLCYASLAGEQTFDLLPLPFHDETVRHVGRRAREAAEILGCPLVLENITYYATMPGSDRQESAFLRDVLEEADAGLLLDLTNLYVNATNHGRDVTKMFDAVPLERVRQVHLAGFSIEDGLLLDTHSGPVAPPVWALYRRLLERVGPVPTLVEWDQDIPSLDAVLDEADRARVLVAELCPGTAQ